MNSNFQCPRCKNYFSEKDFSLHYGYCKSPPQHYTTQIYDTNSYTNTNAYTNLYNPTNYVNNYNANSNTVYVTSPTPTISQNSNILLPQQTRPITQVPKQPFRPQTITYFNPILNQTNNYSQLYQNQIINNKTNTQLYQNQPNNITTGTYNNINKNVNANINTTYKCYTCGKDIPMKEQKDHLLSHKLEQEEKDRLQAQRLQDEDLFENLPPEQIEQQRKIEEYIRRQNSQRHNNPTNNNNLMTNDLNINDNIGNLGANLGNLGGNLGNLGGNLGNLGGNLGNLGGNLGGMNMNGFPNIIIRRTTTTNNNNDLNNLSSGMGSPGFFENFFNGNMNMNNDFMNLPPSGGMRRIFIPMGGMGNMGGGMGQNDLNELIERMLHYRRDNPTDAAIVSELPETKIDDINKLDNDKKNCVICMEDFKNGDKITNLPCLHMFHTNCIQSWLKTQNTCPICKFKLTQDNINNINNRN